MKNKKLFALPLLAIGIFVFATAYAEKSDHGNDNKLGPYRQLTTIGIPGGLTGFDISWVDSKHARYYLANRGNAAATPPIGPNIPVIDTERDLLLDQIFLTNAPNGIVAIHRTGNGEGEPGAGTLVVATSPNAHESSKVLFIDLDHPHAPPIAVDNGGHKDCLNPAPPHAPQACRADELAYDPRDHLILVANDRAADRFVTLISTENPPHVVGKIFYDGSTPGNPIACTDAADLTTCGIEQPVWDKKTRKFYLAIPSTTTHPNGEVDEIDPDATPAAGDSAQGSGQGKITRIFPSSAACTAGPAGLVLIPRQRLMTSCGDVLDVATGAVVTHVNGVAGDEIWFNPGDERVYFGHNPAYVVDAETYQQIVGGGAPIAAGPTHSIAADSDNNHIFIPINPAVGSGVTVWTDDQDKGKGADK